jgi:hypothetical protein
VLNRFGGASGIPVLLVADRGCDRYEQKPVFRKDPMNIPHLIAV